MSRRTIIIGLVLIGSLLYAFNMGNVLFWDDADWITQNPCVQDPTQHISCLLARDVLAGIGQSSNYYRPFLMLTFAFNWAVGGDAPWGYHLVSDGLHILSAVLLFLLLVRILKRENAAGIAALVWLIHPLQTEAVTYISGRGDPLSVALMLSAILLWLRRDRWRWTSLACAALAILSRETAVLLPAYLMIVLMAMDTGPLSRSFWNALASSWPFVLLSGLYGVLRLTVLDFANTLNWNTSPSIYSEHVSVRIWTFLQVLWEYLRLSVAPVGLHMERSVPVLTSPWQYPAFLGIALVAAAAAWVVLAWRRGNRIPFFGVLLFLVPLAPSSGILAPINALIYEHWLYLSLAGIATLAAVYGVSLFGWLRARSKVSALAFLVVVVAYGAFLCIQTVRRSLIWGSPQRLYLQILQYEPQNVRVLNNLANLYADAGKLDDAEHYWTLATQADPAQPAPYHNLGNLERDRGNVTLAAAWYAKAIAARPTFWYAYQNLAAMLLDAGRADEAAAVLESWQREDPTQPVTYFTLAQLFAAAGKTDDARAMLETGLPYAHAAGPDIETAFRQLLEQLR